MKKVLGLLASFGLIASTASSVVACKVKDKDDNDDNNNEKPPIKYDDCYDEYGNNVTIKESDNSQWADIGSTFFHFLFLSKEIFSKSTDFYEKMNGHSSDELIENCFRTPRGEKIPDVVRFNYDFTFLITNYKVQNIDLIEKSKEELKDRDNGNYLFLNFPKIDDLNNIQNQTKMDFQFYFLIKKEPNKIIGNENNNWFYWLEYEMSNVPSDDQQYFFNFDFDSSEMSYHVVTGEPQPQI